MKFRRVRAVARKELLHILRDVRSLIMALALPVFMLVLFGYALTLDVDRIPIVVMDHAATPESRDLLSRFEGSRYFSILSMVDSYDQIEEMIDRTEILAALVIPEDYTSRLEQGRRADVQLIFDGSDSNTASIGLAYAQRILAEESATIRHNFINSRTGLEPDAPLTLETRVWYNPELESRNYIIPGLVAVILMIIAALLTSLTIAREWEMGTMEQLLSTPVRPSELVMGKMSAYFLLGAVDTLTAVLVSVFVFSVPLRGNLPLLAASCAIFIFGALCWGILLSALVRSQLLAFQLGMVSSFLPAFLLSGFIFAIENMPIPVQIVTYVIPARYFIKVLRGLFLKDVGLGILGIEFLLLLVFGIVIFFAASWKLGRKVA